MAQAMLVVLNHCQRFPWVSRTAAVLGNRPVPQQLTTPIAVINAATESSDQAICPTSKIGTF
eukprot:2537110-Amphidinium_carterae.1